MGHPVNQREAVRDVRAWIGHLVHHWSERFGVLHCWCERGGGDEAGAESLGTFLREILREIET